MSICYHVGTADTSLKDVEVAPIDVFILIETSMAALRVVLQIAGAGQAGLKVPEVLLIHVDIRV